jgi:cellulose biosynthesis protein BcsQ
MCIAIAAAEYGREVLLVDLDERSSLSFQFMIENPRFTMLEVATNNTALDLSVIRTSERIDFLPAAPRITALDTLEISAIELKNKFSKYELVVIDTPSALNQRSNLAAQISDAVLYPTTDAMIAIRGVLQAHDFYADLQQLGVLPIRQDDENVSLAQIANKSLMNFAKLSAAADAYRDVTYFLLEELLGGKSNATL